MLQRSTRNNINGLWPQPAGTRREFPYIDHSSWQRFIAALKHCDPE
jgi:hypothetical protein